MRGIRPTARPTAMLAAAAALLLAGCTDTVFRDREPFHPPPDASSGFLGYFTVATRQTTCGNCHVGTQRHWVETGHARAYADLVNSGNAQSSCFGCHTVNQRGNRVGLTGQPAGWDVVQDSAYRDVQCEACHGPGLTHVQDPDNEANWPIARAHVRDSAASCAACHSGIHHPFVEQWAQSGHADSATNAYPGGRAECASCHNGKAAIVAFSGQSPNYVEAGGAAYQFPITCTVCHDPHGSANSAQLRAPIDVPDVTVNLCTRCHNRASVPTASFTIGGRGPHAAQGGVLLGEGAGWIPPGFAYDTNRVYVSHASSANPRLCAGCHVNSFTVSDPASGNFVFQSVGHLFAPNPCLDANGVPTKDNSCAYTGAARNWSACTASGCHANADVAAAALVNQRNTVALLVNQLWTDLNGNKQLDPAPIDAGMLATVLANYPGNNPAAFCCQAPQPSDNTLSVAEGALFNVMMLGENLYDHNDGSKGVHNPFFYEALLSASIQAVQTAYGLAPAPAVVQVVMNRALSRPGVAYRPGRQTATR